METVDLAMVLAQNDLLGSYQQTLPFGDLVDPQKATNSRSLELSANQVEADQLAAARGLAAAAISVYWRVLQEGLPQEYALPHLPEKLPVKLPDGFALQEAEALGRSVARLDPVEAGYRIGCLYTAALPRDLRARLGAYYTPLALTKRLLDMATEAGVQWNSCRVLDPACGGGAFLAAVALRILDALDGCQPDLVLDHIESRIRGFEIDPFAAWLSQVLLEAALLKICHSTERRLSPVVLTCNSLDQVLQENAYDLVIGNPPYGRVTLGERQRTRFRRSLYGHANLYGIFTDLAIRWTRSGGVIAYVTPTSFLGGEYFKALRRLLAKEAPPIAIDLVSDRQGVFENVLQETLLATYRRGGEPGTASVSMLVTSTIKGTFAIPLGRFTLPEGREQPWLLPRTVEQAPLIERMRSMTHRLRDYGYRVSTGPLVWNRHKPQLRDTHLPGCYPLIWAESVTSEGSFSFRFEKKNHLPFFQPRPGDGWLITRTPCVLVQRTTAKEQRRRLIAAELPDSFLQEHKAVVIENHLNMVRPIAEVPLVPPGVVAALLNSDVVDEAFRCINGSVAVSASELESLPLPPPNKVLQVDLLLRNRANKDEIDQLVRSLYLGERP